jgi:hypothetical protein
MWFLTPRPDLISYFDTNLPLSGPNGVEGRSIVIHKSTGERWVCANILPGWGRPQPLEDGYYDPSAVTTTLPPTTTRSTTTSLPATANISLVDICFPMASNTGVNLTSELVGNALQQLGIELVTYFPTERVAFNARRLWFRLYVLTFASRDALDKALTSAGGLQVQAGSVVSMALGVLETATTAPHTRTLSLSHTLTHSLTRWSLIYQQKSSVLPEHSDCSPP